jgi:hypothetical protein
MKPDADRAIRFVQFLHTFQSITRAAYAGDSYIFDAKARDTLVAHKRATIGDQPHVRDLFEQVVALIDQNPGKYFGG